MNEDLVIELKNTIKKLKIEILEKQQQLDTLIEQYQELTDVDLDYLDNDIEN